MTEKDLPMQEATFGIVGSETAFSQLYTHFVKPGIMSLEFLLDKMSTNVAKIFDLPYGNLAVGQPADLVVIDLDKVASIEPESFLSKGRNTPYAGQEVYGWPILTISQGRIAYQDATFFA